MKIKYLVMAAAAATLLVILACEEALINPNSQEDWTNEGWKRWKAGDYHGAETAFGNAIKVDPFYAEAYGGQGWTYIRLQQPGDAGDTFEDAILLAEQGGTPLSTRQLIYMGAATAFEADDEYAISADRGRYMANNLLGTPFTFKADTSVTDYDLYIILSLDYYAVGDSTNCVWAINKMRALINEQPNYQFQNWQKTTQEIDRLVGLDPS